MCLHKCFVLHMYRVLDMYLLFLMIDKGKTLTINLDNQATSNHFQGQPIYGVVESMKDSTGNEMLKAQQQAVQRTEK